MNLQQVFSRNFRVAMAERGLSITKVSELSGVSRTSLSNIAHCHSVSIRFETIEKIAQSMNIDPENLLKKPTSLADEISK
ncbi:helix-turn-helix domain-containing protein [Enterococcus olivae]